ncbi:response regulator [Natrinema salaciae]|uniref:CheY chemotaxis protein or a CheY-like REC (Receiver) domain n=1 Tax=Natrinema salaciae TaxID=1186196 RepID=A0A1H9BR99_9EURY|nr:response regulator [Natrinema salaciae]SEP91415.1 CheY chemotaxis protein or a CheY-like REC (receiver) domain [Natrinema salaciae]
MNDAPPDSGETLTLLLVEDNPGDARLVEEALSDGRIADSLHVVSTGDEALAFVARRGEYADAPRPDLILLDWNLPGTSGEKVLEELGDDPAVNHIPVVVLTGSQAETDVVAAYSNHANACITKSGDPDAYNETIRAFEEFWLSVAQLPAADGDT